MFQPVLNSDETLLWMGKPDLQSKIRRERRYLLMLTGGLVSGILMVLLGTYFGNGPREKMNILSMAGLLIIMISAIWFATYSVSRSGPVRRIRKTYYAVTDQRVLIQRKNKLSQFGINEITIQNRTFSDGTKALILFDSEYDAAPSYENRLPSEGAVYYAAGRFDVLSENANLRVGAALGIANHPDKSFPGALGAIYAVNAIDEVEQIIRQAQKNAKNRKFH